MASSVEVRLPSGGGSGFINEEGEAEDYRLLIVNTATGKDFTLKRSPKEIEYSGFANTYNEAARPDRKPLLRRNGRGLRKINMTFLLAHVDIEESIDDRLGTLRDLAKAKAPLEIRYGDDSHTEGEWSITNFSFRSVERNAITDEITRSEVTLEFTEVPDPTNVDLNSYAPKKRPKVYKTKEDDTLFKIVKAFYGTDNIKIVNAVAKINDIENVKHKMKAGRKIKLP
jgi:LysM repeat protein